jgi:hypothetical protein
MLVLQNCETLTLPTLKRIHEIAEAGVPIAGEKPQMPAGYLVSTEDKSMFTKLADEIWRQPNTYAHVNWSDILEKENILPDLTIPDRNDIDFMHRRLHEADIYFLYNPDSVAQQFECIFRDNGRIPELWDPMSGRIQKSGQFESRGERTAVWLNLDAEASVFVVFRESAARVASVPDPGAGTGVEFVLDKNNQLVLETGQKVKMNTRLTSGELITVEVKDIPEPLMVEGPWHVEFLREHDYQGHHVFESLTDWKDNPDENVRYYSGTAIYLADFDWPLDISGSGNRCFLDLGKVRIVAEVILNGNNLGVSWMAPY